MKKTLVLLLVFGMIFSPVFAGDDNWDGFNLQNTNPSGDPIIIWNCDWDGEGPYLIHAEFYLESPFEENMDVEMYVYNPNTNEWFLGHTCINVDDGGKNCKFYIPVYWGLSEDNDDSYINLVRAELKKGDDVYSKTFNFHISHKRTSDEEFVLEKIDVFNGMMSNLECQEIGIPVADRVSETRQLAYECQMSDSKQAITGAINELEGRINEPGICDSAEVEQEKEEEKPPTAPPATPPVQETPTPPAETAPVSPPPVAPATDEGGELCAPALALLVLAAGFAWRKN